MQVNLFGAMERTVTIDTLRVPNTVAMPIAISAHGRQRVARIAVAREQIVFPT